MATQQVASGPAPVASEKHKNQNKKLNPLPCTEAGEDTADPRKSA